MAFPVNEKYILETESKMGIVFPPIYRKRILTSNGREVTIGEESWKLFPVFDVSEKKRISRSANHIVLENNKAREWDGFPMNAIAIGVSELGDYLVLLIDERNTKQLMEPLFAWNHETGTLEKIAESIDDL